MAPGGRPERVDQTTCGWRSQVLAVAEAATETDGRDPLDEAVRLRLADGNLSGAYAVEDGFALLTDGHLDLVVHPRARGEGRGRTLLDVVLADAADAPLTAWSHGNHPAAARLAAARGFDVVRELWLMRRDPAEVTVPAAPAGVQVRSFVPEQDDEALLAVNAAAFADHPEQGGLSAEGLRRRMAEPWFDPAGLFLAVRDEEVLGFHWTKVHPDGTGEVYVVGVAPHAQGQGLARTLVATGLAHLSRREVVLYVEGANRAAIGLYTSLGFDHADTDVQYSRH